MLPVPYRIQRVRQETDDTFTLEILPEDSGKAFSFAPGQFNMLYVFGVGEVPISISSDPDDVPLLKHTTRVVGTVTKAMRQSQARRDHGDSRPVRDPLAGRRSDRPGRSDCGGRNRAGAVAAGALPPDGGTGEVSQDRSVVWHAHSRGHAVPPRTGTVARQVRPGNPGDGRSRGQHLAWQCRRGDDHDPARSFRSFQYLRDGLRARGHDALYRDGTAEARRGGGAHLLVGGTQHEMRDRLLRPLPVRPDLRLQGRPGFRVSSHRGHSWQSRRSENGVYANPSSRSGSSPPATVAS